ncbi:hypothetical protein RFI_40128, partial [Reticulomyxa filosa]
MPPVGSKLTDLYGCTKLAWSRRHIRKVQLESETGKHERKATEKLEVSYVETAEDHPSKHGSDNEKDDNNSKGNDNDNDNDNDNESVKELPNHWLDIAKIEHGGLYDEETVEEVKQ